MFHMLAHPSSEIALPSSKRDCLARPLLSGPLGMIPSEFDDRRGLAMQPSQGSSDSPAKLPLILGPLGIG